MGSFLDASIICSIFCLVILGSEPALSTKVDCQLTEWSRWTQCHHTCGQPCENRRWRTVTSLPENGGTSCDYFDLEEVRFEDIECPVPVDARVSEWSDWSWCSETCGFCTLSRTRSCLEDAEFTGRRCDTYSMFQRRLHIMGDCPVPLDCEVSPWSEWTECLQTCGICERVRYRQIVSHAENGGRPCSYQQYRLAESRSENLGVCQKKQNCSVCNWTGWSRLISIRKRSIATYPANGGSPSPRKMVESSTIRQREIPKDCILSEWSNWAGCDRTCGHCYERREKSILQEEEHGGRPCGDFALKDKRRFSLTACRRLRRRNSARY